MKKFWEFKTKSKDPGRGELYLYGEISDQSWWGDEVTPALFGQELAGMGELTQLDVYINSPGGDAFAGIAIYNMLFRHTAKVTVQIDGLAASAASVIAMAGDRIVMPKSATLMIHNAWTRCGGGAEDLRKAAEELERLNAQMADIYASRTGLTLEEISKWMAEETWMGGEEAMKKGFADEVLENKKAAACADVQKWFLRYKHPPFLEEKNQAEVQGGNPEPVADTDEPDQKGLAEQKKRFWATRKNLLKGC